jgi:hypothetical protein
MNLDPHSEAGKEEPNKQPKSQNIINLSGLKKTRIKVVGSLFWILTEHFTVRVRI